MKYSKFNISNYKAISEELVIDFKKDKLIPIIGVNECGKTTILKSIFAFDYANDSFNQDVNQLDHTFNLFETDSKPAKISAEIELTLQEFKEIIKDEVKPTFEVSSELIEKYTSRTTLKNFENRLIITRDLNTKKYTIDNLKVNNEFGDDLIAREVINYLPYILYFDDFKGSIEDVIEIKKPVNGWLAVIEKLFSNTDENFSVFKLKALDERIRKTVLAKVTRYLNETLTKEWSNFKLDNKDSLKIDLTYEQENIDGSVKEFIKLSLIETSPDNGEFYFNIKDRSKGFYWFFNFVMKLEFNPKTIDAEIDSIFLLDEPGAYLHPLAQGKLCKKLKDLSQNNCVIYCTHSHYLLNPEIIPLNQVHIAQRICNESIALCKFQYYNGELGKGYSPFQTLRDALMLPSAMADLVQKKVLMVEGIYDYYSFLMFRPSADISIFPGTSADSIKKYIPYLIFNQKNYIALWDNDREGREHYQKAKEFFGEFESKRFLLLPLIDGRNKTRLENLYKEDDLAMFKRELELSPDTSFEKTIASLFYSEKRTAILMSVSKITKTYFDQVWKDIEECFEQVMCPQV